MRSKHVYLFFFGLIAIGLLALLLLGDRESKSDQRNTNAVFDGIESQPSDDVTPLPQSEALYESSIDETLNAEILQQAEEAGIEGEQLESVRNNVDKLATMVRVFSSPIELYGKVEDLEGNPIAGANVKHSIVGQPSDYPEYLTTDDQGQFYLSGKGSSVYISVSKEGYYRIKESYGSVGYSTPSDRPRADDPSRPAVFKLRKKGVSEPLIKHIFRGNKIAEEGEPIGLNFLVGQEVDPSQAHVLFKARTPEKTHEGGRPLSFPWECEISVPGGGLVERHSEFDFTAPEDGYVETISFGMTGTEERWSRSEKREFFARLGDGSYARFFLFYAGSGKIVKLESYLNPTGSRNLEYDPKLEIE